MKLLVNGRVIPVPDGDVVIDIRTESSEERAPRPLPTMEALPLGPTISAEELQAGRRAPAEHTPEAIDFLVVARALEARPGLHSSFTLYRLVHDCGDEETYTKLSSSKYAFHRPGEPVPRQLRAPSEVQAADALSVKWRRMVKEALTFVNRSDAKGGTMTAELVNPSAGLELTGPKALQAAYPEHELDPWLLAGGILIEVRRRLVGEAR